jgi:hypothetical protein
VADDQERAAWGNSVCEAAMKILSLASGQMDELG